MMEYNSCPLMMCVSLHYGILSLLTCPNCSRVLHSSPLPPSPYSVQVFVDEIDAIAPKRDSSQRGMERRIVAQVRATYSYAYEE
jgi:hypothetical protein